MGASFRFLVTGFWAQLTGILILLGNATNDALRRMSKKADVAYTTLGMRVSVGRDRTEFFDVRVFSSHVQAAAKHVTKGLQVLLEGRIDVGGKGPSNVVADPLVLSRSHWYLPRAV